MDSAGKTPRTATLQSKHLLDEASQTWHLTLRAGAAFSFIPGQFLSVLADRTYPATHARAGEIRTDTRAYSLANAPHGDLIELCLNRLDTGTSDTPRGFFSNFLCDLQIGEQIRFHGPHGNFTYESTYAPILILAEETGIAPVRSILQHHKTLSAHLIQATTTSKNPLYSDDFRSHATLNYHPVDDEPTHSTSLIAVKQVLANEPAIRQAYIVGLSPFVNAHRTHLKELNWDRKQIIFERYD
jgi:ferredoxin-NADP reductase